MRRWSRHGAQVTVLLAGWFALPAALVFAEDQEAEHTAGDVPDAGAAPHDRVSASEGVLRVSVPEKDGMLRIPGGRFVMGSNDKIAQPNEKPAHAVTVGPFFLDRTEVTVRAYRACVEAGVCEKPKSPYRSCTWDMGEPELPISCVRWKDAATFCTWANKRLPREIEWEFAARGATKAVYPWGNSPGSCIHAATLLRDNSAKTCVSHPTKVGTHKAGDSVFRVADLSGNVEEWVADWYAAAPASLEPVSGASHVLRGGGWMSIPSLSRTTSRSWGSAMEAGPNVGFRCARDVP